MPLRYDPYAVFRFSKTPPGLYARQKWLEESGSAAWRADFQKTVAALRAGQFPDGSWNRSKRETISRLFGLHLTVRESDAFIASGLDWLLKGLCLPKPADSRSDRQVPDDSGLKGLPFVPGDPAMLGWGATLFLAAIFGRQHDPAVVGMYRKMCSHFFRRRSVWSDPLTASNLFRALVVHPEFSRSDTVQAAVQQLANLQTDAGDWQAPLPFYQTLNALAHLDFPTADRQLERAFDRLAASQNKDGSWGRSDPEWNTFLAVHALRNKRRL